MSSISSAPRRSPGWPSFIVATLVAVAAADYVIYWLVEPVYEASSLLRIHSFRPMLFADPAEGPRDHGEENRDFLETEIQILKTDQILKLALANQTVVDLPSIRGSVTALGDLRADLKVVRMPNTNFVTVSCTSKAQPEVATIVDAVVAAYLEARDHIGGRENDLRAVYQAIERFLMEIERKKKDIQDDLAQLSDADRRAFLGLFSGGPSLPAPSPVDRPVADEAAKFADQEGQRVTPPGARTVGHLVEWKAQLESLARDEELGRHKRDNLAFMTNRDFMQVNLIDRAIEPGAPIHDPRWVAMAATTAVILLVALAVGLRWAGPRGSEDGAV